jgi:hypothetical protein
MRRVSTWHIIVLNVYWIGLSFMWNSLHVIILPAVLLNFFFALSTRTSAPHLGSCSATATGLAWAGPMLFAASCFVC